MSKLETFWRLRKLRLSPSASPGKWDAYLKMLKPCWQGFPGSPAPQHNICIECYTSYLCIYLYILYNYIVHINYIHISYMFISILYIIYYVYLFISITFRSFYPLQNPCILGVQLTMWIVSIARIYKAKWWGLCIIWLMSVESCLGHFHHFCSLYLGQILDPLILLKMMRVK